METQDAGKAQDGKQGAGAAVPASVVVLKLAEFARKPVPEQAQLKSGLEALAAKAIQPLAAAERIVLEAPDALAVVVLAKPQVALELAERCEAAAGALPLCVAVNHGPVRQGDDPLRGPGLVGDGIATGMVLADAAAPGRLLASRPFHEALEATNSRRASDLAAAGELTDANVRRHELYTVNRKPPAWWRDHRAVLIVTLAAIAMVGVPYLLHRFPASVQHDAPAEANKVAKATPAPMVEAPKVEPPRPAPKPKPKPAPPPKPASIRFHIRPHGYVYIDGVAKGRTPPLSRLEIRPGRHSVEVRSGHYPPLKLRVNLSRAEEMTITHTFVEPREPRQGLIPRLRRKLGI